MQQAFCGGYLRSEGLPESEWKRQCGTLPKGPTRSEMSDVAQLPSDDESVSAHSVLVRSESASGGGKSRCGAGYALTYRLLDRVMGADREGPLIKQKSLRSTSYPKSRKCCVLGHINLS